MSDTAEIPTAGSKVGRYLVIETVGRGAMGTVLAAFDPELDRKVAIKVLRRDAGEPEHSSVGRGGMLREAQALARLSHRNVVAVHDVGLHEGRVFIAMAFVDGVTMSQWLVGTHPTYAEILERYLEAGQGLAAAHAAGLVHRDFKPHNVLIGDDGRVRVTDFGLARPQGAAPCWSDDASSESVEGQQHSSDVAIEGDPTRVGDQVGTPAYMAPEQLQGTAVDPRADQFSFCVALYEGVYGERPFGAGTAVEISQRVAQGRVRAPPPGHRVPKRVRRALLRGLSGDPGERFHSMEALLAALRREPLRRWRRVAFVVLPPISLGAWWWAHTLRERDDCTQVAERLDGVWDARRKETIGRRFQATGLPYAMDSWQTVRTRLDTLAAAWLDAQQHVCEVARREVPRGLGRRMACLHRRFVELRSYSDLLIDADETLVEHAVSAVDALGAVSECDDIGVITADIPPQSQRRIVEALAHARVLGESGLYDAAVKAATTARREAEAVGDRWFQAEATFELGRVEQAAGQMKAAHRTYHDAFSAGVAARHDEVVFRAAMSIVVLAIERDKDFASAANWIQHAQGALDRMGDDGTPYVGQLNNVRGRLAFARGHYDEARDHFTSALALRRAVVGPQSALLAGYHVNLGHALAKLDQHDAGIAQMQAGLRLEQAQHGHRHPRTAVTLAALCSVERDVGDNAAAIVDCRHSVGILRDTVGEDHPRTGTALVNLGAVLEAAGQHDEALEYFIAALANARAAWGEAHPRTALVLNNLAVHYEMREQYAESESFGRQSLAAFTTSLGAEHATTATVASNLANVLGLRGKHEEAERILRSTVVALEHALGPSHPDLALAVGMLGETYRNRGDLVGALPHLERTLSILDASNGRPQLLSSACFALGTTLHALGDGEHRGVALVRRARTLLVENGGGPERISEIDDWLATLR